MLSNVSENDIQSAQSAWAGDADEHHRQSCSTVEPLNGKQRGETLPTIHCDAYVYDENALGDAEGASGDQTPDDSGIFDDYGSPEFSNAKKQHATPTRRIEPDVDLDAMQQVLRKLMGVIMDQRAAQVPQRRRGETEISKLLFNGHVFRKCSNVLGESAGQAFQSAIEAVKLQRQANPPASPPPPPPTASARKLRSPLATTAGDAASLHASAAENDSAAVTAGLERIDYYDDDYDESDCICDDTPLLEPLDDEGTYDDDNDDDNDDVDDRHNTCISSTVLNECRLLGLDVLLSQAEEDEDDEDGNNN